MTRTALLALGLVLGPSSSFADEKEEEAKEKRALVQGKAILTACEAYLVNPANDGTFPTELSDLVKPKFGGASFLQNGKMDILDPWGQQFQYALAKDDKGNLRPYVWTERTVDKKTKVIGTKPPEPKK